MNFLRRFKRGTYKCLRKIIPCLSKPKVDQNGMHMSNGHLDQRPNNLNCQTDNIPQENENLDNKIEMKTSPDDQNGMQMSNGLLDETPNNLNSQTDNNPQENENLDIMKEMKTSPDVEMVKAPLSETGEFTMSSKDLPGIQPLDVTINSLDQNGMQMSNGLLDETPNNLNSQTDNNPQENENLYIMKEMKTSPDDNNTLNSNKLLSKGDGTKVCDLKQETFDIENNNDLNVVSEIEFVSAILQNVLKRTLKFKDNIAQPTKQNEEIDFENVSSSLEPNKNDNKKRRKRRTAKLKKKNVYNCNIGDSHSI
ncbi:kinesin-related protein 2-like isoform X3 [Daktulosphaira vitifoliae]|uniref:kinesin-related protein 2-like isoform X3 n=2 Tax=Daktulosphaira vitifoliae TaxID=58002 RepID=UPI0021AAFE66|nr:kinesin-related protein 2-like isoform X3 [Daktulosphaira vitifoliae]